MSESTRFQMSESRFRHEESDVQVKTEQVRRLEINGEDVGCSKSNHVLELVVFDSALVFLVGSWA